MFEVACLLAVFVVPIAIVIALSSLEDARCETATSILLAAHAPVLLCFIIFPIPTFPSKIATSLTAAATLSALVATPVLAIFSATRVKRFKKLAGYVVFLTTINFGACFLSWISTKETFVIWVNALETTFAYSIIVHTGAFIAFLIVATASFNPFVTLARLEDAVCEKTTAALLSANALFLLWLLGSLDGLEPPFSPSLELFDAGAIYEFFTAPTLVVVSAIRLRRFKELAPVVFALIVINAVFWFPVMNVLVHAT